MIINISIGAITVRNVSVVSRGNLYATLAATYLAKGTAMRSAAVRIYTQQGATKSYPSMVAAYKDAVAQLTIECSYSPAESAPTYSKDAVKYALQDKKIAKNKAARAKRAAKKAVLAA